MGSSGSKALVGVGLLLLLLGIDSVTSGVVGVVGVAEIVDAFWESMLLIEKCAFIFQSGGTLSCPHYRYKEHLELSFFKCTPTKLT